MKKLVAILIVLFVILGMSGVATSAVGPGLATILRAIPWVPCLGKSLGSLGSTATRSGGIPHLTTLVSSLKVLAPARSV